MNSRHLIERFESCRERGEALVLVTVWETLGSTYSKAGSRMLITAGGDSEGLVSGGCLESDLAERANQVLGSGEAATVTYDLRDEADELFGLGIGCNGLISVLLQPVAPETDYEPLASIGDALLSHGGAGLATVIESSISELRPGATLMTINGDSRAFGVPAAIASKLVDGCLAAARSAKPDLVTAAAGYTVLYAPLRPVPRILILGAGLDAVPLVNVVAELGWRVTVADHRSAYLERPGFARAEDRIEVRPESVANLLDLGSYDAIVVMSHHLVTDREYLRRLAGFEVPYLGILGPPARRARLVRDLGEKGRALDERLHGPVGIDIGADSAESIAVSIAAEIQQVLVKAG